MALPPHSGPRPLIQFRKHFSQTVGLLGRVVIPSQGLYPNTGQHKHRINTYTHQTSIPWVRFQPTNPASKRAKALHALDRAATVTGSINPLYSTVIWSPVTQLFSSGDWMFLFQTFLEDDKTKLFRSSFIFALLLRFFFLFLSLSLCFFSLYTSWIYMSIKSIITSLFKVNFMIGK
jgi:hypothetical protein